MHRNLFIIKSVNVLEVRSDKHICDTLVFWCPTFGRDCAEQILAEGGHEEESYSRYKKWNDIIWYNFAKSVDQHTKRHVKAGYEDSIICLISNFIRDSH